MSDVATAEATVSATAHPRAASGRLAFGEYWQRLRGHRVTSIADQVLVSATNFLTTVIIGRVAGQDALGVYLLAFSVMMIVLCVQESLVCIPYTVRHREVEGAARRAMAGSALAQALMLGVLLAVLVGIGGVVAYRSTFGGVVAISLAAAVPFILLRDFARRISFAHLDMTGALAVDFAVFALQIGLLLVLAKFAFVSTVNSLLVIALACAVPGGLWLWFERRRFRPVLGHVSGDARASWPLGSWVLGSQLIAVVSGYAVYWYVTALIGPSASGELAACAAIVLLANPILLGTYNYLPARLAAANAEEGTRGVARVAMGVALFLAVAMVLFSIGAFLFGPLFVRFVYGAEFQASAAVSGLFAISVLALAVGVPADHTLWVRHRPAASFWTGLAGLAIMSAIALAAIPRWGLLGAMVGLVVGNATTSVLRWWAASRLLRDELRRAEA